MFRHKKDVFKFTVRKHSVIGMVSFIMGILSTIGIFVISYLSSLSGGNGGILFGVIGIGLFLLSIVGFVLGIKSCKEKEVYYTAPTIGLVTNGFISVIYFLLYVVGISL